MAHRQIAAALIASLALLGAAPTPARAQADPAQASQSVGINVDFQGGTLEAYVEVIRESNPHPINVIFQNEAAVLPVTRITLRNVSVGTALEVAIPDRGVNTVVNDDGAVTDIIRSIEVINSPAFSGPRGQHPEPAYVINAERKTRTNIARVMDVQNRESHIEIFSLADTLRDEAQTRDLLHAVDLALDLDKSRQKAEIKLHQDTMLLITRGTSEQIEAVANVIDRMRDTRINRAQQAQVLARQISQLRTTMIERRADMEEIEIRRDLAAQQLQKAHKMVDSGAAPMEEVQELEGEYRILESRMRVAQARLMEVSDEIARLSGDASDRPEATTREYALNRPRLAARILSVLQAVDGISGHIRSVQQGDGPSRSAFIVEADEEGHEVVDRIIDAISEER